MQDSRRIRLLLVALALAALVGAALPWLAGASTKRLVVFGAALIGAPILFAVRDRERLCLAALIFLLTVQIDYYILGLYAPHSGGAQGLFIKPSDIPLILLYGLWLIDWATGRTEANRRSLTLLWLFLPFVAAGLLSVVFASNKAWASYEWTRWVRAAVLLFYVLRRVRTADVAFVAGCLAFSVMAQSTLGLLQTGLRRTFGLEKLGVIGEGSESVFAQDFGLGATIVRAAGTLGHPNLLGAYLDLTLPLFFALALIDSHRTRRWIWLSACVLGTGALGLTLSRASWGAFGLGCAVCGALLLWMRVIDFKRLLTVAFVGTSLALIALAPIAPAAMKRVTFNLSESIDFREDMNNLAKTMVQARPLTGVGLNNFTISFLEIDPPAAEKMRREWGTIAAVHNLYYLVLSETGALGFAAFLFFLGGGFVHLSRLAVELDIWGRTVIAGVLAGISAVLAGDFLAFAMWTDPVALTVIVMIGLSGPLISAIREGRSL